MLHACLLHCCRYFDAATASVVRELYAVDFQMLRKSYTTKLPVLTNAGTDAAHAQPKGPLATASHRMCQGVLLSDSSVPAFEGEADSYSPPEDVDDDDERQAARHEVQFVDDREEDEDEP